MAEDDRALQERVKAILKAFWVPIALGGTSLLFIIISIVLLVKSTQSTTPIEFISADSTGSLQASSAGIVAGDASGVIMVDIAGGVERPGVYELPAGSRAEDAITLAGGLSNEADMEVIGKQLNRAMRLSDGMKVYIPMKGETSYNNNVAQSRDVVTTSQGWSQNITGISINTASQSQLESLPGIGPVTAAKIISGRPYGSIEELVNKKAVGQALFEKIKNSLSL